MTTREPPSRQALERELRVALARHVLMEPEAIEPHRLIGRDLHIKLVDLLRIVLRLERRLASEFSITSDFPVAQLVVVRSVGELRDLFLYWMQRAR
jgi:hypothetical protein